MTMINSVSPNVFTSSPEATVISAKEIVVRYPKRRVTKGAGAKLSYTDLRRLAKTNPPPQSWYDETNG